MSARPMSPPEARIAELTQKLRAEQVRAEHQRPGFDQGQHQENRSAVSALASQQTTEAIENAAKAAVARAVLPLIEDVTIRPIPPKPSLFPEQSVPTTEAPATKAFIPPAPERSPSKPRRMPEIDELPRPAQAELRAQRGEHPETEQPEKRRGGDSFAGLLRWVWADGRRKLRAKTCHQMHGPAGRLRRVQSTVPRLHPGRRRRFHCRGHWSRYQNMPSAPLIRRSTRLAGRPMCIARRINSTFQPSCADKPIEDALFGRGCRRSRRESLFAPVLRPRRMEAARSG